MDDSGETDEGVSPVIVLGGFIGNSLQWAAFSDEWKAALDKEPALDYFKMVEAENLRGQFSKGRGWTDDARDERISALTDVIRSRVQARVSISLNRDDFIAHVRTARAPKRTSLLDKAYGVLFHHAIFTVAAHHVVRNIQQPVDFIFDEQGSIGNEAVAEWDRVKAICADMAKSGRTNFLPYLGSRPIFRDEKTFLPLQAADLYAWQVRRHFYENRGTLLIPPRKSLRDLGSLPQIHRHLGTDEIKEFGFNLKLTSSRFSVENPEVKQLEFEGSKKAQRRARVAKRASSRKARPSK
jgi:hypothetical protein